MSALRQLLIAMSAIPRLPPEPRVVFRPDLLRRTRQVMMAELGAEVTASRRVEVILVAWSPELLNHTLRGVLWHDDEHEHCRTWSDAAGCRCDLGDEA